MRMRTVLMAILVCLLLAVAAVPTLACGGAVPCMGVAMARK